METTSSYYSVLGVSVDSSSEEIRRAYRKLAMRWHPDRWINTPSLLTEAKSRFQKIQEAYSVLSDQRKRNLYDAGLYDPEDENEDQEGFSEFVQEMVSLMADGRREEKTYSLEELQKMFMEMADGFQFGFDTSAYNPIVEDSSRTRWSQSTGSSSSSSSVDEYQRRTPFNWEMFGYCCR